MQETSKEDFKISLKKMLSRHHTTVFSAIFLIGLLLRFGTRDSTDIFWQIIGDFGAFIAATVAISFLYERFIKAEERLIFKSDLEEILDNKLAMLHNQDKSKFLAFHPHGRLPIQEKTAFIQGSKKEVIEVGIALRSFTGYFYQRSAHEFKMPVIELLRSGVNFKCVLLDPDSEIAEIYASDRGEPELVSDIRRSLERLYSLRDEFKNDGLAGSFEIYVYSHFPCANIMLVDPKESNGRAYISHYMLGIKRADTPVIEIRKAENSELFEKYVLMVESLLLNARKM